MKKLIATFLAALMSLMPVTPVLAATALSGFPGFLAVDGTIGAYVVVGATAATSDVVGAIDVAARLAELSYTLKTVPGVEAVTVEGKETKDVGFESAISDIQDMLGAELTKTHVPFLIREEKEQNATKYTVVEKIQLPAAQVKTDATTLNGSIFVDWTTGPTYNYTITGGLGSGNLSETKPLSVSLMGTELKIKSTGANSFVAFAGTSGMATATTPVTFGGYSVYSDLASDDKWARIIIKDAAGTTVGTDVIDKGSSKDFAAAGLTVKVIAVRALTDGTVVGVELVVGPKGEVEKTYSSGDYFPGTDLWKIYPTSTSTMLYAIGVTYSAPNATHRYIKLGDKIVAPNNYFEIGARDLNIKSFATITVSTGTVSVYSDPTATTPRAGYSARPAIILEADYPVFNAEASKKAYLVMNETTAEVALAYLDATVNKAIYSSASTNLTSTATPISFSGKYDRHTFTLRLLSASLTAPLTATTLNITDAGGKQVIANYTWVTSEFTLGSKSTAEASDVDVSWETMSGGEGTWEFDAVSEYGTVVSSIKSNAGVDKVIVKVPAQQQTAIAYAGKLGAVIPGEQTYKEALKVTYPVAKLDTEVGTAEKAKHLVLVGGPCVNTLVAELATAGKFPYGCVDWPGRDFARVQVIDDAFTTGKVALVVAGTRAADTRLGTSALQQDKLATRTESAVEITGTIVAPVITAA